MRAAFGGGLGMTRTNAHEKYYNCDMKKLLVGDSHDASCHVVTSSDACLFVMEEGPRWAGGGPTKKPKSQRRFD